MRQGDDLGISLEKTNYHSHYSNWNLDHCNIGDLQDLEDSHADSQSHDSEYFHHPEKVDNDNHVNHNCLCSQPKPEHQFGCLDVHLDFG